MNGKGLAAPLVRHYPALGYPNYVRLMTATALSSLGSQITVLALSVAVFSATGSVAGLAGIWVVRVLSRLLMQPFTGALADRWDRRRMLFLGNLLSAGLSAALVSVTVAPLAIYPIVFLIQTVEGLVGPAMAATVPQLVPKGALVSANALRVVLTKVAASLGPAMAGVLYGLVGPTWLFVFDALTFLGVAVTVLFLPQALQPPSTPRKASLWMEAAEGVRLAAAQRTIMTILLLSMLTSLFWRVVEIVMVPISVDVARIGPAGLGLLYTSLTVGGVAGAAVLGALRKETPRLPLVILLNAALGLPMLFAGLVPSMPVLVAAFFVSGVLFDVASVAAQSLLQASVPSGYLGRVFSLVNVSLALGVLPVLIGLDPLVGWLGLTGALQAASVVVITAGAILYGYATLVALRKSGTRAFETE